MQFIKIDLGIMKYRWQASDWYLTQGRNFTGIRRGEESLWSALMAFSAKMEAIQATRKDVRSLPSLLVHCAVECRPSDAPLVARTEAAAAAHTDRDGQLQVRATPGRDRWPEKKKGKKERGRDGSDAVAGMAVVAGSGSKKDAETGWLLHAWKVSFYCLFCFFFFLSKLTLGTK